MYSGVGRIFSIYWKAYGGLKALVRSFYLHLAIILLAGTFNTWTQPNWWDTVVGVLPNLLGFTLGGFAIFIGFGDERFRALLADAEDAPEQPTIYVQLCSTFVHFIVIQVVALAFALVAKSWWFYAEWIEPVREFLPMLNGMAGAIGFGLFLYSVTSILAATMHVFRIANMYEQHRRAVDLEDKQQP